MTDQTTQRLEAATQDLADKQGTARAADAELKQAVTEFENTPNAAHQKAVLTAEQAKRFAEMAVVGSSRKLEAAKREHEQAQHAARLAELEQRTQHITLDAFRQHTKPMVAKILSARKALAALENEAAAACLAFSNESDEVIALARTCQAPSVSKPDYTKALASELARKSGDAVEVLRTVYGVAAPPNLTPDETLRLLENGQNPTAVSTMLAELAHARDAVATIARAVADGSRSGRELVAVAAKLVSLREKAQAFPEAVAASKQNALSERVLVAGASRVVEAITLIHAAPAAAFDKRNPIQYLQGEAKTAAIALLINKSRVALVELGFPELAALASTVKPLGDGMNGGFAGATLS